MLGDETGLSWAVCGCSRTKGDLQVRVGVVSDGNLKAWRSRENKRYQRQLSTNVSIDSRTARLSRYHPLRPRRGRIRGSVYKLRKDRNLKSVSRQKDVGMVETRREDGQEDVQET